MTFGPKPDYLPDTIFSSESLDALSLIVCIPAYNETNIVATLASLAKCKYIKGVGVILVINAPENASEQIKQNNKAAFEAVVHFYKKEKPFYHLEVQHYAMLPKAKAGVGLARKLAMDRAVQCMSPVDKTKIIVGLDADCLVATNYLEEIRHYFDTNPKTNAASIYFEHPIPTDAILRHGILAYETHLRYLKQSLHYCGFPWYYHTVGSSMALRAESYIKSGGMNTRQAGEDFYFLQKLMPLGFGEITATTVFPEARFSNRVPFGTGRSMEEFQKEKTFLTYNFGIFLELKPFFQFLHRMEEGEFNNWKQYCSAALVDILLKEGVETAWLNAQSNTANFNSAKIRFWKWFSGFKYIKVMHLLRDAGYSDRPVFDEISQLFPDMEGISENEILEDLRQRDRYI